MSGSTSARLREAHRLRQDGPVPAAPDALLTARLAALDTNLERTIQVCDARERELLFQQYPVDSETWNRAFRRVRDSAQEIRDNMSELAADLASDDETPQGAWGRYDEYYGHTKNVARACGELMGGFALRDQMPVAGNFLDQRICLLTENLTALCNKLTDPDLNPVFAIPTPDARVGATLTRVIRLQFPEWSVWTLPLVTYEYARVVFDDLPGLKTAVAKEVGRRQVKEPGTTHELVEACMADVFGTYVMGPAYVCAAVLLRLEPLRTGAVSGDDTERAETMFAALRELYGDEGAPFRFVAEHVVPVWRGAREVIAPGVDREAVEARAREFARRAVQKVQNTTYAEAKFFDYANVGEHWMRAKELAEGWVKEFAGEGAAGAPPAGIELREVLNAGWCARLLRPASTPDFARRRLDQCTATVTRPGPGQQGLTNPKSRVAQVGA